MGQAPSWRSKFVFVFIVASVIFPNNHTAVAETSVSVYGGYAYYNGPTVAGHGTDRGGGFYLPIALNTKDFGFYGFIVASAAPGSNSPQLEFYVDGMQGKSHNTDIGPFGSVSILSVLATNALGAGGPIVSANSELDQSRYEIGLRNFLSPSSGITYFVNPFAGYHGLKITSTVYSPGAVGTRQGDVDSWFVGMDFGARKEFRAGDRWALTFMGAVGSYWIQASGKFSARDVLLGAFAHEINSDRDKFGVRTSARAELTYIFSPGLKSAIYAEGTYWSAMPFAEMPLTVSSPPAHIGFGDIAEYRIGVKLTAVIGAKP